MYRICPLSTGDVYSVLVYVYPPYPAHVLFDSPARTGQYTIYGALGEQKESTKQSFKGLPFGGSGVERAMTLPNK